MLNHLIDRARIFEHRGEYQRLHDLFRVYVYVLLVWGFYRVLFRLPVAVEELGLKPILFLGLVWWSVRREGLRGGEAWRSVGMAWKNLFAALAFGLSLGVFYLFVGRLGQFFRFGEVGSPYGASLPEPVTVVLLALATAVSEQVLFMGYLLPRLQHEWKNEWLTTTVVAVMFAVLHLPVLVFYYRLGVAAVFGQFLLSFILAFGNSVLMLRLRNVAAPILSHALWGMAVLLFR